MPRGLGAREAQEARDWDRLISYRPRRGPPAFQPSSFESAPWRLDGSVEEVSRRPQRVLRQPIDGAEAQRIYSETVKARSASAPLASSSAVTLDEASAVRVSRKGKGKASAGLSAADAIDLESDEDETRLQELQQTPSEVQHCVYCQSDVRVSDWASHIRSLPHLLASDTASATLEPHIAIKESNIGRMILTSHGWVAGDGLGLTGSGRPTPLKPVEKHDRLGIGLKRKASSPLPLKEVKLSESSKERNKRLKQEGNMWRQLYSYIKADF